VSWQQQQQQQKQEGKQNRKNNFQFSRIYLITNTAQRESQSKTLCVLEMEKLLSDSLRSTQLREASDSCELLLCMLLAS